jgi:aryl-alcohol dehydrogenase-like predicted oxidoreductase
MQYRELGSTGLTISRLILGAGNFGGVGSAPEFYGLGENEEQAAAIMDRAIELGVTVFDTANSYGGGRSEAFIGRWLKAKGSRVRDHLILSSKVFNPVGPGPGDRGLSRAHILRQIDASLTRLQTDRLDLYLTHEQDPGTPIEETLGAFDHLVRAGKVRHVGASNIDEAGLTQALDVSAARGLSRYRWVQNSYSLLDRSQEAGMFPLCDARAVGFTAFSPLAGGWLTGKYRAGTTYPAGSRMTLRPEPYRHFERADIFRGLDALADAARARGVEMSALALAWALHHPRMDAIVVGPRRPAHLATAASALQITLTGEEAGALAHLFAPGEPA